MPAISYRLSHILFNFIFFLQFSPNTLRIVDRTHITMYYLHIALDINDRTPDLI